MIYSWSSAILRKHRSSKLRDEIGTGYEAGEGLDNNPLCARCLTLLHTVLGTGKCSSGGPTKLKITWRHCDYIHFCVVFC